MNNNINIIDIDNSNNDKNNISKNKKKTIIHNINNDTNNDTNNDINECFICYGNFKKNDNIIKLKCGHIFHKKCICLSLEYMGKIRYTNNLICSYCNQIHMEDYTRYSLMKLKRNIKNLFKIDKNN